mmetsp:Transcript_3199/g.7786  ORF Transcript_3199/g.7786 Transcript_3199/m.7786 type:complete len:203 (-) Transcript_3199:284-892(-)
MSSDEEDVDVGGAAAGAAPAKGTSKTLGLRIQKKLMGMGVKSKEAAKHFIDDESGAFLDVFYELVLKYTGDVKKSKKVLKDTIKIAVKVGLLYRHNQYSAAELTVGNNFRSKLKMSILTMISYHDVAFTFDAEFLIGVLEECQMLLKKQISAHLTAKSLGRVDNVFSTLSNEGMLTALFTEEGYKEILEQMNTSLNQLLEKI